MATVNVYLTFNGNCEEAFNFYKSVLGGDFSYVGRYKDMPKQDGCEEINDSDANKIMHITLPIGNEISIMGNDSPEQWASSYKEGNNFSLSVDVRSKEEADRIFRGLSAGGHVTMPMQTTFWSAYFAIFTDKFGINWSVTMSPPQLSRYEERIFMNPET